MGKKKRSKIAMALDAGLSIVDDLHAEAAQAHQPSNVGSCLVAGFAIAVWHIQIILKHSETKEYLEG